MLLLDHLHDLLQNDDRFNDFFQRRALRVERHDVTRHLAGASLGRRHAQDLNKKEVGGVRRVQRVALLGTIRFRKHREEVVK